MEALVTAITPRSSGPLVSTGSGIRAGRRLSIRTTVTSYATDTRYCDWNAVHNLDMSLTEIGSQLIRMRSGCSPRSFGKMAPWISAAPGARDGAWSTLMAPPSAWWLTDVLVDPGIADRRR